MANLPTKSFSQIVTDTISGIQGRAAKLINFSQGSALRAIVEGFAGLFLWFQALILLVLQASRLSTAQGSDVDTFTGDYMPAVAGTSSPRLGAQASSGQATFARFTAAPSPCFIPVGSTCSTTDGNNTSFTVTADATYPTYSANPAGYTLASNVGSIIVPVQCVAAGKIGNIQSGALSSINSPITGIDTVTNVAAFSNGADQESDSALKNRFAAYILGLARGDYYGLAASILGTAVNVQWTLTEGYNYDGSYHPGYFFVVADDGSGNPSTAFLNIINAAAQAVRPLGNQCSVFPPVIMTANVSMQLTTALGYDHNTVVSQVAAIVAFNINSLGLGNPLPWSMVSSWAYGVPGVTAVSNVLINGSGGDNASLKPSRLSQDGTYVISYASIKAGTLSIS